MKQEDDIVLEEIFSGFKPELKDEDAFMDSLSKRLAAVEFVKRDQEMRIRKYKYAVAIAFLLGGVFGGMAIAAILTQPLSVPLFTLDVQYEWLLPIAENSRLLASLLVSVVISYVVVNIVGMLQELVDLK